MNRIFSVILLSFFIVNGVFAQIQLSSQIHPRLLLNPSAVQEIKNNLETTPILKKSYEKIKKDIDQALIYKIDVPVPKDPAGGYTHEKHKKNANQMYEASILWQISHDTKYLNFVRTMLLKYADLYPTLKLHPVKKSYAPGKLFWQILNESVWLVYTAQAYDCVYDGLSKKDRKKIEQNLLIPVAKFLSDDNPKVFNRIHNHGVWADAAVGITGIAINNKEFINRALYGLKPLKKNQKAGFLEQCADLFSPDGYYTEGPYYQRYAMFPYLIFAQVISNNLKEINIYKQANGRVLKAVNTILQLTDEKGRFFPLNDAVKGMNINSYSMVAAVDIAYNNTKDKKLLSIAKEQNSIWFSEGGLRVALALKNHEEKPFIRKSQQFFDGKNADLGAIGVLRSRNQKSKQTLVFKYASHGMNHGHFDRLGMLLYDNGEELFPDYGSARYVNVIYKHGGRYLKENKTWAKQTIAHNTMVIDSASQFQGNYKKAKNFHSIPYIFDVDNEHYQLVSAKDTTAYKGVSMQRTLIMLDSISFLRKNIILDLYRVESKKPHQIDFPYHYKGTFMNFNAKMKANTDKLEPLGTKYGYQHLWVKAQTELLKDSLQSQFIFYSQKKFFCVNSVLAPQVQVYFTRLGANDPEFNLRPENAIIYRFKNTKNLLFVSSIEQIGTSNPVTEEVYNKASQIKEIKVLQNDTLFTVVKLYTINGHSVTILIANSDKADNIEHSYFLDKKNISWKGKQYLYIN